MCPRAKEMVSSDYQDMSALFTERMRLEGTSSNPQLKQLQPQLVQWGTVERTVPEADKLSLPTDIVLLGLRLTEKKKCL